MKKIISLLLSLTFIIGIAFGAINVSATSNNLLTKKTFQYPITPSSVEWKNYNQLELKEKLNISIEETQELDTKTLIDLVLDYPFLGDIYAFNDQEKAIDMLAEQFNGLKILLKREDVKEKLLKSYFESSEKIINSSEGGQINFQNRFKQKYKESLFKYPVILDKLSKIEKENIISKSEKVASKISTSPITFEPETLTAVALTLVPGDIIRTGYVLTPNQSSVPVFEREEMTAADKASYDAYMASTYPNAQKLRSATYKYNCHSYAWYSNATTNTWWMDSPYWYMNDGSYTTSTASVGYKIYYPMSGNLHTGVISSVSGGTIYVTSKWGAFGLYYHRDSDCPYFSMYQNTYWRR